MKRFSLLSLFLLMVLFVLVGCGGSGTEGVVDSSTQPSADTPSQSSGGDASGILDVSIAGSTSGGVFYVQSAALAEYVSNNLADVRFTVEVTSGGHENAIMIDTQENAIGISSTLAIYEFTNGLGNFPHQAENLTAMAFANPNELHIVVSEDSDIYSVADLKGKVVNPGNRGSGTESSVPAVLEPLSMSYDNFARVEYLGFSEAADAMRDGAVDAIFWLGGYPASSIQELDTTLGIRLIAFSPEEIEAIVEAAPYFQPTVIPGGSYTGIEEDVETIALPSIFLVNKNMPEDFVYELTKITAENIEQLARSHVAFHTWLFSSEIENHVPLHPGAKRYYEEESL